MIIESLEEFKAAKALLSDEEAVWMKEVAKPIIPNDRFATHEECVISTSLMNRGYIFEIENPFDEESLNDQLTDLGKIVLACYVAAHDQP